MITIFGKSFSFGFLCVSTVGVYQFCVRPGFEGGMWDYCINS